MPTLSALCNIENLAWEKKPLPEIQKFLNSATHLLFVVLNAVRNSEKWKLLKESMQELSLISAGEGTSRRLAWSFQRNEDKVASHKHPLKPDSEHTETTR